MNHIALLTPSKHFTNGETEAQIVASPEVIELISGQAVSITQDCSYSWNETQ